MTWHKVACRCLPTGSPQYREGKYLIKRFYAFSRQKAVRTEEQWSISRNTEPWGPIKQFNTFQPACRCCTVSTRASYCLPASFHTQNITQNTFCFSSPFSPSGPMVPLQLRRSYWFAHSPSHGPPYPVSMPILVSCTALSISLSLLPWTPTTNYTASLPHPTRRSTSHSLQWEPQISHSQSAGRSNIHIGCGVHPPPAY